uniref:Uncharacterized protein n=1 Tax=Megaselia scalaris TaxID=36166 RepID=T1GLG5_MEGSC
MIRYPNRMEFLDSAHPVFANRVYLHRDGLFVFLISPFAVSASQKPQGQMFVPLQHIASVGYQHPNPLT